MKDLFSLYGKNAVVVGGGGGIGQALAKGLAYYGASVAIAGRDLNTLNAAADAIEAEIDKRVLCFVVDVTDERSVERLVNVTQAQFDHVDILVNAQGINIKKSAFDMMTEEWDKTFAVNVRGVMLCSLAFARSMRERGEGRIISLSSVRAVAAAFGGGLALSYGSSKGAVNMFTKELAAELAASGVTVNAICPAATRTAAADRTAELIPDIEKRMIAKIPLGRMALPDDMIGAAVLLASDAGSFITGANIFVDGGMSCVC